MMNISCCQILEYPDRIGVNVSLIMGPKGTDTSIVGLIAKIHVDSKNYFNSNKIVSLLCLGLICV